MLQRRISHEQVIGVLTNPNRTLAGNARYTKRIERDFPNGKTLVVIVEESDTHFNLVTTFWAG